MMLAWHEWLDSVDSDGGHVVILLLLIILGVLATHWNVMHGDEIVAGSFGALLLKLKEAGSNAARRRRNAEPIREDREIDGATH